MEPNWKLLRVIMYVFLFSGMITYLIYLLGKQRTYRMMVILLAGILGVYVCLSFYWRMELDSPLYLYTANMMLHDGAVPYKDIYDVNPIGTHFFYYLHVLIYGTSDIAFRIADLIWLGLTLLVTYSWMRRINQNAGVLGCLLYGLLYFRAGPQMSLERDFIILLPISMAMYITLAMPRMSVWVKAFLVGLLFAITFQVKPQSGIGLPILLLFIAKDSKPWKEFNIPRFLGMGVLSVLGFAIPIAAGICYLYTHGALTEYNLMTRHYWPMYSALNNLHQYMPHRGPGYYLPLFFMFGGHMMWVVTAALGFYAGYWKHRGEPESQPVLLIAVLALGYCLYPTVAGKFWEYHWMVWLYFTVLLSSFSCRDIELNWRLPWRKKSANYPVVKKIISPVFVVFIVILVEVIQFNPVIKPLKFGPKKGRVDKMANYLRAHIQTGDMVQPLDWTGGAMHAMLLSHAKLATRFIYDVQFYQNINDPYIQGLRSEFITAINKTNPRYFVEVTAPDKPYVSGPNTTRDFPELQEILKTRYQTVMWDREFVIYERIPNPVPEH